MKHTTLIERFRENEDLAEKFHLLETRILGVLNFQDFFQALLDQIGEIFAVPHVWLSLIKDEPAAEPIHRATASAGLRERLNQIEAEKFRALFGRDDTPLLENESLEPYFALLPEVNRFHFRSLAMVPLTLYGQLVGSLNLADPTPGRYRPGYNPIHLERLAVKVSLCLSNVTAHENLKYLAFHDPLTDLYNRRAMEQTLQREFARALRYGSHLSLAFVDLDLFKSVNDSFGHDCGDALLQYLAAGMTRMCRQSDVVTRLAGDEFVLLLPETVRRQAQGLLERMADHFVQQPLDWQGKRVAIRISFGISSVLEDDLGAAEDLLKLADERLYQKKQQRQNDG